MFDLMFIIVPVFIFATFIFTFAMVLSPKLRGKMMSRQIKATKYMIDESKETLEDIATNVGDIHIKSSKNILDNNEENLKEMVTKGANISKEGIETTVRAIKDGLKSDVMYCKHCGKIIDDNSKFCKYCGKKQ